MNKLTDAEIIERFTRTYEQYKEKGDFRTTVYEEILDLIKRKDAEIERMQENIQCVISANVRLINEVGKAKSEAIKEFEGKSENRLIELYEKYHKIANKPKNETDMYYQGRAEAIWECITTNRNLVKEMTENITKIEHNSLCETETYKGEK